MRFGWPRALVVLALAAVAFVFSSCKFPGSQEPSEGAQSSAVLQVILDEAKRKAEMDAVFAFKQEIGDDGVTKSDENFRKWYELVVAKRTSAHSAVFPVVLNNKNEFYGEAFNDEAGSIRRHITSRWCKRRDSCGACKSNPHQGMDIASQGRSIDAFVAMDDMTVVDFDQLNGACKCYLDAKDSFGAVWRYLHMSCAPGQRTVQVGDVVARGALLGYAATEINGCGSGPHLHLEMHSPGSRPVWFYAWPKAGSAGAEDYVANHNVADDGQDPNTVVWQFANGAVDVPEGEKRATDPNAKHVVLKSDRGDVSGYSGYSPSGGPKGTMHCKFNPEAFFGDRVKNSKDKFRRDGGSVMYDPRHSYFFSIANDTIAQLIRDKIQVTNVGTVQVSTPPPLPPDVPAPRPANPRRVIEGPAGPSAARVVEAVEGRQGSEPTRRPLPPPDQAPPAAQRPAQSQIVRPGSSSTFCETNNWVESKGPSKGRVSNRKWVDGLPDAKGNLGLSVEFNWHEQDDTRRKFSVVATALEKNRSAAAGFFGNLFKGQSLTEGFLLSTSKNNSCKWGNFGPACIKKMKIYYKRGTGDAFYVVDQFQQHKGLEGKKNNPWDNLSGQPVNILAGNFVTKVGSQIDHKACLPSDTSLIVFEAVVAGGGRSATLQVVR